MANKHPNNKNADAWDKVKKKNGKLTGKLTDELAKSIFNFNPGLPGNGTGGGKATKSPLNISAPRVNKHFPSKFK